MVNIHRDLIIKKNYFLKLLLQLAAEAVFLKNNFRKKCLIPLYLRCQKKKLIFSDSIQWATVNNITEQFLEYLIPEGTLTHTTDSVHCPLNKLFNRIVVTKIE